LKAYKCKQGLVNLPSSCSVGEPSSGISATPAALCSNSICLLSKKKNLWSYRWQY